MWAVIFTDLVGSTSQRARLGDDAADALRREHDSIVQRAAALHGGEIIKGLGDGAMVVFRGASDAMAAGAAIQQAVDRRNPVATEAINVRVGISLGDLVYESGDLHGMAANEAARLCAHASGGEVLITDLVRAVAGSRNSLRLEKRGELEFKGLPDAVKVWSVEWEAVSSQSPLLFPRMLDAVGALPFTGREAEMAQLGAIFADTKRGQLSAILIVGEPGIGKTRLASQMARSAYDDGALVLYGRCDEQLGVPFQPFVEMLTSYFEQSDRPRFGRNPEELARIAPAVGASAGTLAPPLRTDPATEQYRLFDAVRSWLQAAADELPVVLVLDDAQWATSPTLMMLLHVLRTADSGPVLVLVTLRDTEALPADVAALLGDLKMARTVKTIALDGLDRDSVDRLVDVELGVDDDRPAELGATVLASTGGNPFFIGELLLDARESGVDPYSAPMSARHNSRPLPSGARDAVEYRVARLDDDVQEVLAIAAVVGLEFQTDVVAALAELSPQATLRHLTSVLSAKLVHEVDADVFAFSHALVQSALEQRHTDSERMRIHRRVAETLIDVDPQAATAIAFHWCAAGPCGDPEAIVNSVLRAAHEALLRSAPEEALEWYRRAEAALVITTRSDGGRHTDAVSRLQIAAGAELSRAGRQREATELLRVALESPTLDSLVRAQALRLMGCGLRVTRAYPDAVQAFKDASEALTQITVHDQAWWTESLQTQLDLMELYYWTNAPAEMAMIEASLADGVRIHGLATQRAAYSKNAAMRRLREQRYVIDEEIERLMDEAVDLSADGDDPAYAFHLFNRGFVALWRRDLDYSERYLQSSLDLAQRAGDAVVATRCLTYLSVAARFRGHRDTLRERVARAVELADLCGLSEYTAAAQGNRAWALLREGRPADAKDAALEALQLWRGLPITYAFEWQAWFPLLQVAVNEEDLDVARDCVDAMLDSAQQRLPLEVDNQLQLVRHADHPDRFKAMLASAAKYGYA
jgi:hypothetical protein